MAVFSLVLAAVALYCLWRALRLAFFYFREYFVLWHIATGGRSDKRGMSAKIRLHVYVCRTELLDEVSVNELYGFLVKMMDSDVGIRDFHSVVLSYNYAIICRERKDGSLRGVMLMGVDRRQEMGGVRYTLIRLGLSFFQNYYRGGPLLYYVMAYHVVKELLLHPLTPLFVVGKIFSYKSYVALCHNIARYYPRHGVATPDFARGVINRYGEAMKTPSEEYDKETFVLKRERTSLKEGVATPSHDDLHDPNIKFFVERNPGWVKGHQMICIGEVRWSDFFRFLWRMLRRAVRARREGAAGGDSVSRQRCQQKAAAARRRYSRHYSFQSEEATRFATVYSEMDIGGWRNDHAHDSAANFFVQCPSEVSEREEEEEEGEGEEKGGGANGTCKRSASLHSYDIYDDL